jgi:hypothetical protein
MKYTASCEFRTALKLSGARDSSDKTGTLPVEIGKIQEKRARPRLIYVSARGKV